MAYMRDKLAKLTFVNLPYRRSSISDNIRFNQFVGGVMAEEKKDKRIHKDSFSRPKTPPKSAPSKDHQPKKPEKGDKD
jgi:hypothetical protein